jgi:hypothetical protein
MKQRFLAEHVTITFSWNCEITTDKDATAAGM